VGKYVLFWVRYIMSYTGNAPLSNWEFGAEFSDEPLEDDGIVNYYIWVHGRTIMLEDYDN